MRATLLDVNGVEKLLDKLGLTEALRPKLAPQTGEGVSDLVAKGEIDLAITVITQIVTTPGVELTGPLPPELHYYIQFVAGVSSDAKAPDAARALLKFLGGADAGRVIVAQGLEPS